MYIRWLRSSISVLFFQAAAHSVNASADVQTEASVRATPEDYHNLKLKILQGNQVTARAGEQRETVCPPTALQ